MQTTRRYSRFGDPASATLPDALLEQARRQPDGRWLSCIGGETLTFGEALRDTLRAAGFLQAQGIRRGDRVVLFATGQADFVRAWLGLQWLGAVAVLLNPELRGAFLRHQLADCGAKVAIVEGALVDAIAQACAGDALLDRVLQIGGDARQPAALATTAWAAWRQAPELDIRLPQGRDIACVMYTSGTTGPSKGVLMPHTHCALYGIGTVSALAVHDSDRYYIVLPLHHANGLLMQLGATLIAGIPAIVRARFSATTWLSDIREHGATLTNCLGALAAFICAQPPTALDRSHSLRALAHAPTTASTDDVLRSRFGIADVVSGYGMTESNMPVLGKVGQDSGGTAGWVTPHFELIVADPETDRELPAGQSGEILVRPRIAFGCMSGYLGQADKTVEAWRNLWFHTGDAGVIDAQGRLRFVDRIKDCIRRRGENISPSEIEALLTHSPGVHGIAAYAVPSPIAGGEDEVMLAFVAAPGCQLDLGALGQQAEAQLPRFARPRYLRQMDALPMTATGKVQRAALRQLGTDGSLDRGEPRRP